MIFPSIDKILNVVDSKYRLVHIVSKRSKEMTKEDNYQKTNREYSSTKNIGRALEEVSDGLLIVNNMNKED